MPANAPLCPCCVSIFSTEEGLRSLMGPSGYKHHTKADLTYYAEAGCPLCVLISRACEREGILFKTDDEHVMLYECCGPPIRSEKYLEPAKHPLLQEALHSILVATDIQSVHQARLAPLACTGSPASQYIEGRPIVADISSAVVIKGAKTLLEECLLFHKKCPKTRSGFLPTRLINVGVVGSEDIPSLHVPESKDQTPYQAYSALSYCWGGPQSVTTTENNLQDHLRQLPMERLPQTIRDAIEVTRNLGIRYLWVDALCIVQDLEVDKIFEINKMGEIYKNATLTIAATCSESAKNGFLWKRQVPLSCQLNLHLPTGELAEMFLSESVFEESQRPLDSRGWAFQESTLSPRLLIYGTTDVIWRCSTKNFEHITGSPNERFIPPPRLLPELFEDRSVSEERARELQGVAWRQALIDYTSRDLTFPTDRLSAIAGVASEFGKLFDDQYMAGMWRRTLTKDLGWYRYDGDEDSSWKKCQTLGLRLAPSWSWAKMEQGFIGANPLTHPDIELITHNVEYAVQSNGSLTARGHLELQGATIEVSQADWSNLVDFKQVMDDETAAIAVGAKYLYLGSTFAPVMAIGLVIEPVEDDSYRRVGMIQIRQRAGHPPPKENPYIWAQSAAKKETIRIL